MKLSRRLLGIGLLGGVVVTGCSADVAGGDSPLTESAAVRDEGDVRKPDTAALAGRVIVKFRDESLRKRLSGPELENRLTLNKARIESLGGRLVHQLGSINAVAAELTAGQVEALRKDPRVAYVERDPIRRPFEPMAAKAVTPQAETVPYGITMVQADQVSDDAVANRKVCIVDTGYDGTHEDLRPAPGVNIAGDDNDGLGNDTGDWFFDGYGHGTHVAGTISALRNNGKGVVGINGNNQIGLHIVKVFDNSGSWAYGSDLVRAVEQCVAAGANVISMSLGGSFASSAEQAAFDNAYANGVLSVAAAGNGGDTSLSYPASYDAVVSVAALDETKTLAGFSQRNAQVELAAPGVAVLSTLPGNVYEAWDGTSMATPHVSGVAALVWSHFPECVPAAIRNALAVSAEDLGTPGRDKSFGHGLVQAKGAIDYLAANGCVVPPPPPPPVYEELLNGVPKTGLGGGAGDDLTYVVNVPEGATNLVVALSGGTGDADLYVKYGDVPTSGSWDCRPYTSTNEEVCTFAVPSAGKYYVQIVGYTTFADTSVVASYVGGLCGPHAYTASGLPAPIPDNSATGVRATVQSDLEGTVDTLHVNASITHPFRGDLVVTLLAPGGQSYVLWKRTGGAVDNLVIDTDVPAAKGVAANGAWQLLVQDRGPRDSGTLTDFQLTLTPSCN